jgi:alpha-tubulin suppressor-like RCC1 family protein
LVPKDIKGLSQRKPIFIAAGESHSAAITEKRQLFTWGNGGFGRLGLSQDSKETTPVMVEELDGQEIDYVSLGFSHSLAVTTQGDVYSWGQNKYGKLGL